MKRTTVNLPEDLVWRLEREAKRRDASVSEVVRRVLSEHFGMNGNAPSSRYAGIIGLFDSGRRDVSERMEELLAETWADDIERDRDP